MPPEGGYLYNQPTASFKLRRLSPLTTMNPQTIAKWSAYNTALYLAQRAPPLGTVDMDKKLAQMAREHLIKVANESRKSVR
jgi:hypothetical protein